MPYDLHRVNACFVHCLRPSPRIRIPVKRHSRKNNIRYWNFRAYQSEGPCEGCDYFRIRPESFLSVQNRAGTSVFKTDTDFTITADRVTSSSRQYAGIKSWWRFHHSASITDKSGSTCDVPLKHPLGLRGRRTHIVCDIYPTSPYRASQEVIGHIPQGWQFVRTLPLQLAS